MPGPAPKPKEQRVNRNRKLSGDWVVLPREHERTTPKIPPLQAEWRKHTKDWWKTIWASPMASQWQDADVYGLAELALLREKMLDGELSVTAQVTAKADKFGLTPKGRKDLRWVITDEDAESAGLASVADISNRRRLRATDK